MHYVEAGYSHILPWFIPGTLVSIGIAVLIARTLAGRLATRAWVAGLLVVGFGMIVAATLTPLRGHFNFQALGGTCDLSRMSLAPIKDLFHIDDTSLNIALFVPLGVAIGLLDGSRRKAVVLVAAIAFPFVIETTQLLVPAIERGCQSADVIDNLTGLVIGLALGTLALWSTREGTPDGPRSAARPG